MLGWHDTRELADVLPAPVAKSLQRDFGFTTCDELLRHYPRDYIHHNRDVGMGDAELGEIVTMSGTITAASTQQTAKGKILKITIDGKLGATFFNIRWQHKVLTKGTRAIFSGKLSLFRGQLQLQHPQFFLLDPGKRAASKEFNKLKHFNDIVETLLDMEWVPIYPATANTSSVTLLASIAHVLDTLPPVPEPLDQRQLMSFDAALREVHLPGPQGPERAIRRLKYNEALSVCLVMALRHKDAVSHIAPRLPASQDKNSARARLLASLPFRLTGGQRRVIEEIAADMADDLPMSRLLQGEVGSGKTMVAVVAMLQAVDCGKQAALLAPTEVLAAQHAASVSAAIPDGVAVTLLTGSMRTADKRQALLDIVSGQADIVIGTHAIIQDTVEFFDLGLVVVDEQHRFGVEQRDSLRNKTRDGTTPHTLVMTATPIPRTIAMTVFGDLEVSTLAELPGGRQPIQSALVPEIRPAWVARAFARIREEVAKGHQAYVVCPRIEGDGGVLALADALASGPLSGLRLDVLHGRMADKEEVMHAFASGEIDVLIATTVIEVGVDVPNATVMLIREAENFGVSQLHQLRGRVGRGGNASLCLFHTLATPDQRAFARLEAVAATSSGFDLAELDLRTRQEGDVLGAVQSGRDRTLRLLNLANDEEIIERTHADAYALVQRNPALAIELTADLSVREREYLDKA